MLTERSLSSSSFVLVELRSLFSIMRAKVSPMMAISMFSIVIWVNSVATVKKR